MVSDPTIELTFEVKALANVEPGKLVLYSPNSKEEVYAITAVQNSGGSCRVILNRPEYPPYLSDKENGCVVAGFKRWQIEPTMISVANPERKPGTLLAYGDETGLVVDGNMFLNLSTFKIEQPPQGACAFMAKWKLWVPQFSDGERPAWKMIFEFEGAACADL